MSEFSLIEDGTTSPTTLIGIAAIQLSVGWPSLNATCVLEGDSLRGRHIGAFGALSISYAP
jgi:hypothetical protein